MQAEHGRMKAAPESRVRRKAQRDEAPPQEDGDRPKERGEGRHRELYRHPSSVGLSSPGPSFGENAPKRRASSSSRRLVSSTVADPCRVPTSWFAGGRLFSNRSSRSSTSTSALSSEEGRGAPPRASIAHV